MDKNQAADEMSASAPIDVAAADDAAAHDGVSDTEDDLSDRDIADSEISVAANSADEEGEPANLDDDDDLDDDDADDDAEQPVAAPVSGRRARAAAERKAAAEQQSPPNKKPATKPSARPAKVSTVSGTKKSGLTKAAPATSGGGRRGLIRFLREVIAELGKVVWPGRRELIIYTSVVLVFMILMVAYVAGLDVLFAQGVLAVFG